MAYSATLANIQGLLSDDEMKRLHTLFSRCGLSMDHHDFNEEILDKATQAILKTRDGKLRAAIPSPLGKCVFLNDVTKEDMNAALQKHKEIMKSYPRNGEGLEAFVDASDTGYTLNNKPVEETAVSNGLKKLNVLNDDAASNGVQTNGTDPSTKHATAPEGVDGAQRPNGIANGVNGHVNGHAEVKVSA